MFIRTLLSAAALFALAACQKPENPKIDASNDVDAVVVQNQTYTYDLRTSSSSDSRIYTAPRNASISRISPTGTTTVYEYAPATDFVGIDSVVIVTSAPHGNGHCSNSEHHSGCHHEHEKSHGGCNKSHDKTPPVERVTHKLRIKVVSR